MASTTPDAKLLTLRSLVEGKRHAVAVQRVQAARMGERHSSEVLVRCEAERTLTRRREAEELRRRQLQLVRLEAEGRRAVREKRQHQEQARGLAPRVASRPKFYEVLSRLMEAHGGLSVVWEEETAKRRRRIGAKEQSLERLRMDAVNREEPGALIGRRADELEALQRGNERLREETLRQEERLADARQRLDAWQAALAEGRVQGAAIRKENEALLERRRAELDEMRRRYGFVQQQIDLLG